MSQYDHIPTEIIKEDIAETQREIDNFKREIEGLRMIGDRISNYRANARESFIKEREEFNLRLKLILANRGEAT